MKLKNFSRLLLFAFVIMCIAPSCVKEGPAGPAGPAGADGKDGVDANQTCKMCHNPVKVELIAAQFELSKHSFGEAAFGEAGNPSCAPCHESEGFKFVCKNNTPTAFIADPANAGKFLNPYAGTATTSYGDISCFTCHSSLHSTYGSSDLPSLTTVAPVEMTMWGGAKIIDLKADGGISNLCVKCHQPRPFTNGNGDKNVLNYAGLVSSPSAVFFDASRDKTLNLLIPGYRTHTHYGTAGAIYAGKGGIEFGSGYTNSKHTEVASCQNCHMEDMNGKAGGHSFSAIGNFNGCNVVGCHSENPINAKTTSKYWKQTRDDVKLLLDQLAAKLNVGGVDILNRNGGESNLWLGLTTNNYDGYLNIYDPATNPDGSKFNTSMLQNPSPSSSWSKEWKDTNAALPKITLTNAQMGAIINFQLCLRDYSLGIHNTAYTTTLLKNSIAVL